MFFIKETINCIIILLTQEGPYAKVFFCKEYFIVLIYIQGIIVKDIIVLLILY